MFDSKLCRVGAVVRPSSHLRLHKSTYGELKIPFVVHRVYPAMGLDNLAFPSPHVLRPQQGGAFLRIFDSGFGTLVRYASGPGLKPEWVGRLVRPRQSSARPRASPIPSGSKRCCRGQRQPEHEDSSPRGRPTMEMRTLVGPVGMKQHPKMRATDPPRQNCVRVTKGGRSDDGVLDDEWCDGCGTTNK